MTNKYIDRRYMGKIQIYTDGSKDPENNRVGCAFVIPEFNATYKFKLNDHLTVYSAELVAILMALRWANKNKANSTNLYPPTKGYLRETCKSQNINPIYLTLSSATVSFRS